MAGMEELRSVKNTLLQVASQLEQMQSPPGMTCELFVIRSMHYVNNLQRIYINLHCKFIAFNWFTGDMPDLKWRQTNVLMFGKIAIANWPN